jgi:serine/threonine protein kinase
VPSSDTIFLNARELEDLTERSRYLTQACGSDTALRERVDQMLCAAEQAADYFAESTSLPAPNGHASEGPGIVIGRYELIEKIGAGGMGLVYLAKQREPVRRKVALKIIKLGMDTKAVVARFEAERQALALMDHPNIAKMFDAGVTESGRPYFVMELVTGVPITRYCDENKVLMAERLELFLEVCSAVEHAHQKGVIHRDIKPSNILVTTYGNKPVPKVIDFGIAKATQERLIANTVVTQFQQFIGTPAYMSPEQANLSQDIDTRADIYSLGVLLYELLAGQPPFDNQELLTAGVDQLRRIIREVEPPRPSVRLRGTLGDARIRSISADLDWIVLKCLEKNRSRRYESASALAADIQRHLSNEPVLASPPTASYRLRKFIVRHRTFVVAASIIALAVLAGTFVSTWALFHERAARRQADHRLKTSLAFVDEVFDQVASEIRHLPGMANANEKLAQSGLRFVQQLGHGLGRDPALRQAVARQLLRLTDYQNPASGATLGKYEAGLEYAREALSILSDGSFDLDASTTIKLIFEARFGTAQCLIGLGRTEEAVAEWTASLPLLDRLETFPDHARIARRDRANILNNVGYTLVLANRPEQAIEEYLLPTLRSAWVNQINTNRDAATPLELEVVANLHDALAHAYLFLERFDEMLPLRERATNLRDYLIRRAPSDAAFVALRAECLVLHGCALLVTGSTEPGLDLLDQARQIAGSLVEKENANERFLLCRTITAAVRALAFARWSTDLTSTAIERRDRLQQAEAFLAEAAEFAGASKEKLSDLYVQSARKLASRAKANPPSEERPSPGVSRIAP